VTSRLGAEYPDAYNTGNTGFQTSALSVHDELTRQARPTLLVLLAVTGFVLLLVSANIANLALARVIGRERELALRSALGAGRGRIARQLLTESTLLAVTGGALGLLVGWLVRDLLVAFTARFTRAPRKSRSTASSSHSRSASRCSPACYSVCCRRSRGGPTRRCRTPVTARSAAAGSAPATR
jgi:putative ABC transport system permease protein